MNTGEMTRAEREHEVRVCGNCGTELGWQEPGPRCTDCEGLRRRV